MKYIPTNEWSISSDGEIFTDGYGSKKEAIEAVKLDYSTEKMIYNQRVIHLLMLNKLRQVRKNDEGRSN